MQEHHFRSGWLWSALGASLAVVGIVVWATQPDPPTCDATPTISEEPSPTRIPFATSSSGFARQTSGPSVPGEARYYSLGSGVACSFPGLPPDGFYVGISTEEYGYGDLCGGYLDVRGPHGAVRVLIADHCPGCAPGQLDLSTAAFDQIAERAHGVADIRYSAVRDPIPAPELSYAVKPDSSAEWLAILFSGTGNPLRQVAIRAAAGGAWRQLIRGMDNYWTIAGAGAGPFVVRVTDIYGHEAELWGITPGSETGMTGIRLYTVAPPAPPAPAEIPTQYDENQTTLSGCRT
ncbi:expansin EXLX1 family cellulose-binding protein [Nocardia sp. NPDC050710]|uniref:expansin EXLX1 family cellulose-binding protein n=1 Tax=Nocardia sp. NPDC050710 TaxID=3157220 RepID=UPI00340004E1